MSWPVYRAPDGRYAVAVAEPPDDVVAFEPSLSAAVALAERLNAERTGPSSLPPPSP